jgi:Arrestin (or S-antigen), N-terminal domain
MPSWQATSHGAAWQVELERDHLLPGRLVGGQVSVTADDDIDARQVVVTLIGVESWQHEQTTSDGQGHTTTRTVTSNAELPRVPVELSGPLHLAAGESRTWPVQIPVPGLGPASVEGTVLRVAWTIEAKLDRSGFDSRIEVPVRIAQPMALLRAGVVHVGEFALYPEADAAIGNLTAAIELDPMPLCSGAPFRGHATLRTDHLRKLQEIRAEIRVHLEATVSSGKDEWLTAWASTLVPALELDGERRLDFDGTLSDVALPTIETAHGRLSASFHLILATAFARDPHLARDVSIATTLEL